VPTELRASLVPYLEALPGGRRIHAIDTATGEEAWGVEVLSADFGGRTLVNLTSYNREPITVRLEGLAEDGRTDLLAMAPVGAEITLAPMGGCVGGEVGPCRRGRMGQGPHSARTADPSP